MGSVEIVWKVPESLYQELIKAQRDLAFQNPVDLISQAVQRYLAEIEHQTWEQEFRDLQKQVRAAGGFQLGDTKEEVITRLREQRRQLFETEYAHLY